MVYQMNIIEAVKSGLPFKRKDWYKDDYIANFDGCLSERVRPRGNGFSQYELLMGDLIADDWEVKEEVTTITKTEFLQIVKDCTYQSGGGVSNGKVNNYFNIDVDKLVAQLGFK